MAHEADRSPSPAEDAMAAHAHSRVQQGKDDDKGTMERQPRNGATVDAASGTEFTGPGGDPAEGKPQPEAPPQGDADHAPDPEQPDGGPAGGAD
jgi:hypothetical protein